MAIRIARYDDPARVLAEAGAFLASEAVRHNLILTILHSRAAHPEAGRYWVAREGDGVVGLALQSPLTYPATVTSLRTDVVPALVDAMFEDSRSLPGVSGEAAVAAQFAGCWTERSRSPALPFQGLRLYEVDEVVHPGEAGGRLRRAVAEDRDLVLAWVRAFQVDIREPGLNALQVVDLRLPAGHFFVWEEGEPVSMAAHTEPVAGVVRVQYVYTPPEKRARGYAHACVAELSTQMRARGDRCVLFADLGNPVSNAIYRRLGYRAVSEIVKYRFEA